MMLIYINNYDVNYDVNILFKNFFNNMDISYNCIVTEDIRKFLLIVLSVLEIEISLAISV